MKALGTALFCFGVLFAAPSTGMAQDNLLGVKWKINLDKSKFSAPAPRSSFLTYEATDGGFKVINEGVNAQGSPTKGSFGPYKLDGKPYPVAGVPAYDASSFKMVDDRTTEFVRTKDRKTVQTGRRVLSADGKTLTFTTTGVNEKGEKIDNVVVFDKE